MTTERLQKYAADLLTKRLEDISEDHYAAGWMMDLEYDLWFIVLNAGGGYGMGNVTAEQAAELKQLAEDAGGWVTWDKDRGRVIVPLDEWQKRYDEREAAMSAKYPNWRTPKSTPATEAQP